MYTTKEQFNDAPIGTILEPVDNEDWFGIALKAATFEWVFTGSDQIMKANDMIEISKEWKFIARIKDK
jgi:hypothetical protein